MQLRNLDFTSRYLTIELGIFNFWYVTLSTIFSLVEYLQISFVEKLKSSVVNFVLFCVSDPCHCSQVTLITLYIGSLARLWPRGRHLGANRWLKVHS